MTPRASTATCEILFRIPYILYTNNDPNAKQFEFGNLYIYIYISQIYQPRIRRRLRPRIRFRIRTRILRGDEGMTKGRQANEEETIKVGEAIVKEWCGMVRGW